MNPASNFSSGRPNPGVLLRPRRNSRRLAVALGACLLVASSRAQQFWDGADTTANGSVDGGSGTWDVAATNWTNAAGDANAAFAGGTAVFGGAAGTVTVVGEQIAAGELRFASSAYTIGIAGPLTLTIDGAGVTNHSGAEQTFEMTGTTDGYGMIVFLN
ncbi:MAG TPA: hypothetical protein VHE13_14060 [Opitutus sp.]|nr:hypothetical protein [Opitutus sp.]